MIGFNELAKHKLCYLATPYSRFKGGISLAHVEACKFAAGLIQQGVRVYSPIAHTHSIAMYGNIDPLDRAMWLNLDEAMMEACDALIVAELPGWIDSEGIAYEIAFFIAKDKPVYYLLGDCFT